jgi:3-methyladenine DNA glycosylase AlkD
MAQTAHINNWDLVDLSAEHIVGRHLFDRSRRPFYRLARSKNLWERRIAVMAMFANIKRREFDETLRIAELLLRDDHDLIHKAVGWMLREVGYRSRITEERFLETHFQSMPRTMLRSAIERFPESRRRAYLADRVSRRARPGAARSKRS